MSAGLEELLRRYVEHHVRTGEHLSISELCQGEPELMEPLRHLVSSYQALDSRLGAASRKSPAPAPPASLPEIEGFRTIERLGRGGMGEVYKLEDLTLGRVVAGKMIRADAALSPGLQEFLREASTMALFEDPRIVRIYELKLDGDAPVIVMEHVDGFELDQVGPSLEYGQRARILAEICDALDKAHALGIQHRDLKPSNIMLDEKLQPRILDFGLALGESHRGHLVGSLPYMAPEQLDPQQPIDGRADVYALGVILYELLCGVLPYQGKGDDELMAALRRAEPRLPAELQPDVPEPLQAIALKAMEPRAEDRYPSAREMALELRRFLDGRPVLARPSFYGSALGRRVRPQLEAIEEWLRLKLIYPHEAARLRSVYRGLEHRDDDWIVESRQLTLARIALYLGVFVVACGGLFYLIAHRFHGAETGLLRPLAMLGLPIVALSLAAHGLYQRQQRATAVAFGLASVVLLPVLVAIGLAEADLWVVVAETPGQLFASGALSNRQLQLATLAGSCWALLLAGRTRTSALTTLFTAMFLLLCLALMSDLGLSDWLRDGRYDLLAMHLAPVALILALAGRRAEVAGQSWFCKPTYLCVTLLFVLVLELMALDGRSFHYLGITAAGGQPEDVSDPLLLDSLCAMALNGVLFYGAATLADRKGSELLRPTAWLLFSIAPFAMLEPVAYLVFTGDYAGSYDWVFLGMAVGIAVLSYHRQRKSFYYAGMINTGTALLVLSDHNDWFDAPLWASAVLAGGLTLLLAGAGLGIHARLARRGGGWSRS